MYNGYISPKDSRNDSNRDMKPKHNGDSDKEIEKLKRKHRKRAEVKAMTAKSPTRYIPNAKNSKNEYPIDKVSHSITVDGLEYKSIEDYERKTGKRLKRK